MSLILFWWLILDLCSWLSSSRPSTLVDNCQLKWIITGMPHTSEIRMYDYIEMSMHRIQKHSSICVRCFTLRVMVNRVRSRLSYNLHLNSISSISKWIFLHDRSCTPKGEECLHRPVPFNQRKPIQLTRTITAFSQGALSQVWLIEDKDLFIVAFFLINDNNRSWDDYFYAHLNFYFILVLCLLSDIVFIYILFLNLSIFS